MIVCEGKITACEGRILITVFVSKALAYFMNGVM